MMMSRSKRQSKSEKIRALIKQGLDKTEIATRLKCSYQLVWYVANNELLKGKTKKKPSKNLQKAYHYLGKAIKEHE